MSPWAWVVIGVAVLVAIGYAVRRMEAKGYAHGYAAGRQDERRSELHKLNQVFHQAAAQGLAARRELDYLYEQARRRIDELG
jgi:hypothetical protein